MTSKTTRTPRWAWLLMAAMAATQPLLLLWIARWTPGGLVPTGLHITDSALFLYSMRMADHGLASLYATCASLFGTESLAYYTVPHLWLYAGLGFLARLLHLSDFAMYGLANGFAALLYLYAAYRLLVAVVPRLASRAFVLFALSGGLGGVLFAVSGALGWQTLPGFEAVFRRFAVYDLFEGAHLSPLLLFARSYYTLSLALCLFVLARFASTTRRVWPVVPIMAFGSFIDLRYGLFTAGIAFLAILLKDARQRPALIRRWFVLLAGLAVGGVPAAWLMRQNPAIVQNHYDVTNMAMWFSPFISAAFFHLILLPAPLRRHVATMPPLARILSWGSLGYLAAFTLLFAVYQVYYGNLLVAHDAAVATAISDYALAGFVAGIIMAAMNAPAKPADAGEPDPDGAPTLGTTALPLGGGETAWLALWLLACMPLALSAFGAGWFLRYGPQRIEAFLWLPLCVMSAKSLEYVASRTLRRVAMGVMVTCGLCSIVVSTLYFQGPLGVRPGQSPYASYHSEVMTQADATLIDAIGDGIVLAPIPASDIVVLRKHNRVVFGTGSFNLSDQPYVPLEASVKAFFSPNATDDDRRAFVNQWCVDYIYCPDTWPIAPEVVRQLNDMTWLEKVAESGHGAVFRVQQHQFVVAWSLQRLYPYGRESADRPNPKHMEFRHFLDASCP